LIDDFQDNFSMINDALKTYYMLHKNIKHSLLKIYLNWKTFVWNHFSSV